MLIGAFLRNYKCYKGVNFIPFIVEEPKNLRVFIGNNGVGKSSILEALDTFFNDREWTIHSDAYKEDVSVGVLFLSEKNKMNALLSKNSIKIIDIVNNAFWNINITSNSSYLKYPEFFELRERIKKYKETHYLFILGKELVNKNLSFLSFNAYILDQLKINYPNYNPQNFTLINKMRDEFIASFSYLYIPVETSISEFLRLETRGMQDLMNRDIKKQISETLNNKAVSNNGTENKSSILDFINENLENFVENIQRTIQKIDSEYNFLKEPRSKQNLTANHISDVIIEAYFSKRRLKKGSKSIVNLSAGERKRALVDIAYSFLCESKDHSREIILAIDEPESSLHISNCYEQFNRIDKIAQVFNKQVFITTHWYGALPILQEGVLAHIENSEEQPQLKIFNLENYFERRKNHPDDIHLKSFFDLASSIVSSLRNQDMNWLLVEGYEDQKYLEYYLNELELKILPLGGSPIVKKLYEYIFLPLSNQNELTNKVGKVFCLVDTDKDSYEINVESETKNKLLKIRRLQSSNRCDSISLCPLSNNNKTPTEIEECLDPSQFFQALQKCIYNGKDQLLKIAFSYFEFDNLVTTSFVKGDYSIINHRGGVDRNIRKDKERVVEFMEKNKKAICNEYVSLPKLNEPKWIEDIRNFFTNK